MWTFQIIIKITVIICTSVHSGSISHFYYQKVVILTFFNFHIETIQCLTTLPYSLFFCQMVYIFIFYTYIVSVCTSNAVRNFGTLFQNFLKCSKIFYIAYKLLQKPRNTCKRLFKLLLYFLKFPFTSKLVLVSIHKLNISVKNTFTQPYNDTNVHKTHYYGIIWLCVTKYIHKSILKWYFCTHQIHQNEP